MSGNKDKLKGKTSNNKPCNGIAKAKDKTKAFKTPKSEILKCFEPLIGKAPKVLVLGTMPGGTALRKQEYYGYEHNAFWKLMFDIFETPFSTDYKIRTNLLKKQGIALWDTIASCEREGSSDTAIKNIVYNDIEGFLKKNKTIKAVFLNSKFAYKIFLKAVKNDISQQVFVMSSTSPANTVKYEKKLSDWEKIKDFTK